MEKFPMDTWLSESKGWNTTLKLKSTDVLSSMLTLNRYYQTVLKDVCSQQALLVQNQQWKHENNLWNLWCHSDITDVDLISLLLTLNRFHTLFMCFRTGKCHLGLASW